VARRSEDFRAGWAYLGIVSAVPGLNVDVRLAIAVQFLLFQGAAVLLAVWYELWGALPVATVAIGVATAGSYLMVNLSGRIRRARPPEAYQRYLFQASIDVVMGVLAFVTFVTYLLVGASSGESLLAAVLGEPLPAPAVFLALLIAWDLCYRIGTGWWASVTGLWRSLTMGGELETATKEAARRADALTIAFAGLQLLLVPFLLEEPLLLVAVSGHVAAVAVVSGFSILWLRRC
jgi:hypothetical protein